MNTSQPQTKRTSVQTAEQDVWSSFGIRTLDEYFKRVKEYEDQLAAYRKELDGKLTKKEREEKEKLYNDLQRKAHQLYVDEDIEIEKQEKKRTEQIEQRYVRELKEYKAYLKQTSGLSEKQQNKQAKAKEKATKLEQKVEKARKNREGKEELKRARADLLEQSKYKIGGVGTVGEQLAASFAKVGDHIGKKIGEGFKELGNKINSMMDTYSKYQSAIDTRLQDSGATFSQIETNLKRNVGATPYFKTEDMFSNVQAIVEAGIASNVEQRAFLQTIKTKIATTFDAANGSLLRIVRLQQTDSTAARLGMEAYLTRFLNDMVKNTEYLNQTFDNVTEALMEAQSLMATGASTEFEYVVQKWLGALTGTGLSTNASNNIAGALGKLGSGNISALSGDAMNNLLVMAASRAGLSYSELLSGGLNATTTNRLMESLVRYMIEIGSTKNNVVKSQYASVFGLNVSDLTAAMQLSSSISDISKNLLSYSGMYDELGYQMGEVSGRTHISEKLDNLFGNAQFSLASNIAGTPALAALWKVTDMIQNVTGGINIPAISAFGNMVDLETTVENIMKLGLVGAGSLGMIGDVITGLSNTGNNFSKTLSNLGITVNSGAISRGKGIKSRSSGMSTSSSTVVGNSSGNDIYEQTMNEQNDKIAEIQSQNEEENYPKKIYELLSGSGSSVSLLNPLYERMDRLTNLISSSFFTTSTNISNVGALTNKSIVSVVSTEENQVSIIEEIRNDVSGIYSILKDGTIRVTVESGSAFGGILSQVAGLGL